jgi:hypothetical protein
MLKNPGDQPEAKGAGEHRPPLFFLYHLVLQGGGIDQERTRHLDCQNQDTCQRRGEDLGNRPSKLETVYDRPTVTTSFTAQGAYDKGPYPEEPREGKALTRGSGVATGWATAPPTIT